MGQKLKRRVGETMKTKLETEVPVARIAPDSPPIAFALAIRTQNDGQGDTMSQLTGLITGDETPVRQEFAHTADINNILQNHGLSATRGGRAPTWGDEIDMNFDLTDAYAALNAANRAKLNVPNELQSQFPTWEAVLNGVENGSYHVALEELDRRRKDAEEKKKQEAQETAPKTAATA